MKNLKRLVALSVLVCVFLKTASALYAADDLRSPAVAVRSDVPPLRELALRAMIPEINAAVRKGELQNAAKLLSSALPKDDAVLSELAGRLLFQRPYFEKKAPYKEIINHTTKALKCKDNGVSDNSKDMPTIFAKAKREGITAAIVGFKCYRVDKKLPLYFVKFRSAEKSCRDLREGTLLEEECIKIEAPKEHVFMPTLPGRSIHAISPDLNKFLLFFLPCKSKRADSTDVRLPFIRVYSLEGRDSLKKSEMRITDIQLPEVAPLLPLFQPVVPDRLENICSLESTGRGRQDQISSSRNLYDYRATVSANNCAHFAFFVEKCNLTFISTLIEAYIVTGVHIKEKYELHCQRLEVNGIWKHSSGLCSVITPDGRQLFLGVNGRNGPMVKCFVRRGDYEWIPTFTVHFPTLSYMPKTWKPKVIVGFKLDNGINSCQFERASLSIKTCDENGKKAWYKLFAPLSLLNLRDALNLYCALKNLYCALKIETPENKYLLLGEPAQEEYPRGGQKRRTFGLCVRPNSFRQLVSGALLMLPFSFYTLRLLKVNNKDGNSEMKSKREASFTCAPSKLPPATLYILKGSGMKSTPLKSREALGLQALIDL